MKFAPIVPVQYDPAQFSDFHLILAHEIRVDPVKRAYYEDASRRGHQIILDNGVIELGSSVSYQDLMEAWNHFPEATLVVPDSIRDQKRTIELAEDFAEFIREEELDESFTLMIVPQGATFNEWLDCLEAQLDLFSDETEIVVGIGRYAEDTFEGGRKALWKTAQKIWDGNYHLLGVQHNLEEVAWAKDISTIWGCDSSLPVRAALMGIYATKVENLRELPDVVEFNSGILTDVQDEIRRCVTFLNGVQ
ncbi:hypothetical protein LCGC14_1024320 [marine sediment metagenome]|uniref:Uncharacterized protein n=1 Tax=marine sediment metagenome TaxID=412755 RepID=A0A0F9R2B9_9ZZZZ